MKYLYYILCGLLLSFSAVAQTSEKARQKFKNRGINPSVLLKQARAVQKERPLEAIRLVEEAITASRSNKDSRTEGEAYALLGNIYAQINQKELALQRYQQALNALARTEAADLKAEIHQHIGQVYVDQGKDKPAEENFQLCLDLSSDKPLVIKCQEGLADVQLLRGASDSFFFQLDALSQNYPLDSAATSRIEARRSQAYIQQNDYSRASESFYNSLKTLPEDRQESYVYIQKAQENLLQYKDLTKTDEIALRNNVAQLGPEQAQILENLKIAELYEAENNYQEAEKFLAVSVDGVDNKTDAEVAAEVFKKSMEVNQRKGNMEAALKDLGKYVQAREQTIQNLEDNLKEQLEIVKGQQKIDLSQRDFEIAEKERMLVQNQLRAQKLIIGLLSLTLAISLVFFYFLYKNVRAKRKANQRLLLKSLRSQMNPHFIFNALNSVNNFIAKNDEKAANKFLSDFSRLMRKVLDYSQKDFISFEEEMELNELYLKLEHFRFRDKFDYTFDKQTLRNAYHLEVPPMLIQPFIENAVWHGLRYKEHGRGKLEVALSEDDAGLIIHIQDNGIGREKSKALKTANQKKYNSAGLENVSRRIALINEIYGKNYKLSVTDVDSEAEETGTLVEIKIPGE